MLVLPKKEEELRARKYPWVSVKLKMMMTVMTPPTTPIMRGGVDACRKLVMWYEEARGQQQERSILGHPRSSLGSVQKSSRACQKKSRFHGCKKFAISI